MHERWGLGGLESRAAVLQTICVWLILSSFLCLSFTPHVVATGNPSACWLPVALAVVSGKVKVLENRACLEHLLLLSCSHPQWERYCVSFAARVLLQAEVLSSCPVNRTGVPTRLPNALKTAQKHHSLSNVPILDM